MTGVRPARALALRLDAFFSLVQYREGLTASG
jgi:hypothetical protein